MKYIHTNLKILTAIAIALAISISLMAQPQQRPVRKPVERGKYSAFMADMTEEQKAQIKEIHLSQLKDVQPLNDELKINRARLNKMVKQDNPDMKAITSLVEENASINTKIQILAIESSIKVRDLLSEEQRILYDSKGDRRHLSRQGRGHMRPLRTPERSRI